MASWRCEDCYISMDSDPSGDEIETCPKCGKEMVQFQRNAPRMFGGGGVSDELLGGSQIGQPNAGR